LGRTLAGRALHNGLLGWEAIGYWTPTTQTQQRKKGKLKWTTFRAANSFQKLVGAVRRRHWDLSEGTETGVRRSVCFATILNRKHVNRAAPHPSESHAPVADSQPVSAGEFPLQRFNVTFAGLRVPLTCHREQNPHCGLAFDSTKFGTGTRSPDEAQLQRPNSRRTSWCEMPSPLANDDSASASRARCSSV
jgi:hypothetical protein